MKIDASQVFDLAADLGTAVSRVDAEIKPVFHRAGNNIRRDASKRLATRGKYTRHYRRSITYDIRGSGKKMELEIGPTIGRKQAFLGKILEFGTATSPPHAHLIPAAEAEAMKFAKHLQAAVVRSMLG